MSAELSFELPGTARVLFTERAHGNMSSTSGADAERAEHSRESLRRHIGVRRLARGHQVHGTVVRLIEEPTNAPAAAKPPQPADGQATALTGIGAMVVTADCLPVALGRATPASRADAGGGAVAMVHAGWRGLLAGVIDEGVRALDTLGGEGEVVAIVGPGAGACCYEVGEEVHRAFAGAHRHGQRLDLGALARDRLNAAGVSDVRVLQMCTICDPRFFSHRREGALAGRQSGVAWLG